MIDSASETLIPLKLVPEVLPTRGRGRKVHVSCVYRWTTVGCRGVVLESLQCGATRCTSREALQRFFEALTERRQSGTVPAERTGPPLVRRSVAQRQRQSADAARKLSQLGA